MKYSFLILSLLALAACGPRPENDPIYQQLKANPPTEIPSRHLPRLRRSIVACDFYNEGKANQYVLCWWPEGVGGSAPAVTLEYYKPNPLNPPASNNISRMRSSKTITKLRFSTRVKETR